MPVAILKHAMGSPSSLAVLNRDATVSWPETGDLGAHRMNYTDTFMARGCWESGMEGIFTLDCVDIRRVDRGL